MNSIIGWPGGKRFLAKRIVEMLPKHKTYCEVFGGAAWVLFQKSPDKKDWSPVKDYREVYNDLNGDLVTFWKYVRQHPEAFVAELNEMFGSRDAFLDAISRPPRTELERASMFYLRLACSFSSMGGTFACRSHGKVFPLRNIEKVKEAAERFKNVIIENATYDYILKRYDSPDTVFYLDPPYYGHEYLYERDGTPGFDRHVAMSDHLRTIQGKFILSYNDHPEIRHLYAGFRIEEVVVNYTLSASSNKTKGPELIIKNW